MLRTPQGEGQDAGQQTANSSQRPRQRTQNGDRRSGASNRQSQGARPGFSNKSFSAPKTLTEQVEKRAGPRTEWPKNAKRQIARKPKRPFARKEGGNATSDYTGDDTPRQPRRDFDENGLLVLKGPHKQISQVSQPMLPAFAPLPTSPAPSSNAASGKSTVANVSNTLGVVPYVSRALPTDGSGTSGNPLGAMDNARLALSRVKELNNRKRENALSIVQRLVGSRAAGTGKTVSASS